MASLAQIPPVLLGVAVNQAFASTRFVYLLYTFNKNSAGCKLNGS